MPGFSKSYAYHSITPSVSYIQPFILITLLFQRSYDLKSSSSTFLLPSIINNNNKYKCISTTINDSFIGNFFPQCVLAIPVAWVRTRQYYRYPWGMFPSLCTQDRLTEHQRLVFLNAAPTTMVARLINKTSDKSDVKLITVDYIMLLL